MKCKQSFFIHLMSGKIITVQLNRPTALFKLTNIIEEKTGVPTSIQCLYTGGLLIHNYLCLQNLPEGANIQLIFRIVGGGQNCVLCKTVVGNVTFEGKLYCSQCSPLIHGAMNQSKEVCTVAICMQQN